MARNKVQLEEALTKSIIKKELGKIQFNDSTAHHFLSLIKNELGSVTDFLQEISRKIVPDETTFNIETGTEGTINKLFLSIKELKDVFGQVDSYFKKLEGLIGEVSKKELKVEIPPQKEIVFPIVQNIKGEVEVKNQINLRELIVRVDALGMEFKKAISEIKFPSPKEINIPEVKIPKFPEFPSSISLNETNKIIDSIKSLEIAINEIPNYLPKTKFPESISVNNFPPQKYPMPVTHISINSLKGAAKTTAISIGTIATVLPTTPLADRRSVMIFNNDSSATMYIGGSDVTIANGLPIAAQTYSPSLDAGKDMLIYGVVSSGTVNVRVLEVSDLASGR